MSAGAFMFWTPGPLGWQPATSSAARTIPAPAAFQAIRVIGIPPSWAERKQLPVRLLGCLHRRRACFLGRRTSPHGAQPGGGRRGGLRAAVRATQAGVNADPVGGRPKVAVLGLGGHVTGDAARS